MKLEVLPCYTKIHDSARYFGIRTLLKQYRCYESANIPAYTDLQYLAQYREIINNLQENAAYVLPLRCALLRDLT